MARLKTIDRYTTTVNGVRCDCVVRMDRDTSMFRVECATWNVSVTDGVLVKAKDEAWKRLRAAISIEWRDVLYVQVHSRSRFMEKGGRSARDPGGIGGDEPCRDSAESRMEIKVETWQIGQIDGQKVSRRDGSSGNHEKGWPEKFWDHEHRSSDGLTFGMVDDTPANRAAIQAIFAAIEQLQSKLSAMLGGDQLGNALTMISQNGLGGLKMLGNESADTPKVETVSDRRATRRRYPAGLDA